MNRKGKILLAACVILGLAAVGQSWRGGSQHPAAAGPTAPAPLPNPWIAAPGKVEPRSEEIKVAAAMTGRLAEVRVEEGQRVRRDEILAVVENAEHLARVQQAEANLRLQRANLLRVQNGPKMAERREVRAAVEEARSVLSVATVELNRQQALSTAGHSSQQAFDRAKRDQQVAQARLDAAIQRRNVVDDAARSDDLEVAEANVALAEGRLAELRANYDRTFVRSPVDGVVLRVSRRMGEMVTENQVTPIISVGDDSLMRVRVDVDEADIARLKVGQAAYVTAVAYGSTRFEGTVSRIGSMLGRKNIVTEQPAEKVDTRVLEVLIDLNTRQLPSGLRVDAFITPAL